MIENILFPIMLFGVVAYIALATIIFISANIYDLKFSQKPENKIIHKKLITILIPTHNSEKEITNTLESVTENEYREYQLIVIDNNSNDSTKKLIRETIKKFPEENIRLVAKRKSEIKNEVILSTYKKYGKGELVLVIEPGDMVSSSTLNISNQYFGNEDLDVLRLKQLSLLEPSVTSLFYSYLNMLRVPLQKFYCLVGIRKQTYGTIFRASQFSSAMVNNNFNPRSHLSYADNAFILKKAPDSLFDLMHLQSKEYINSLIPALNQTLFWPIALAQLITAITIPIFVGYVTFLAIGLHEPTLLLLTWALLAVFVLVSVWATNDRPTLFKLKHSLLIPVTFTLFYALIISRLVSILKAVLWPYFLSPNVLKRSEIE